MNCPRCPETALEERERDGVTVDGCRKCRGIWLDRGELERLIARASSDFDDFERRDQDRDREQGRDRDRDRDHDQRPAPPPYEARGEYGRPWKRDDDDDDYRHGRHGDRRHPYRKKRWFEALGDIFD